MIRFLKAEELEKLLPLSAQVNALHEAQHPEQYRGDATAEEVMGFFSARLSEGAMIFVAEKVAGDLTGFILAVPVVRDASPFLHSVRHVELDQICVDKSCRGQGVGKSLVTAMESWMVQNDFREWKSMVQGFNTHSQNLMRGQGAEVLGLRYRKMLG
ncbi:GNAT family N-acetyltransferase [Shimia sagamensis]|uniref:Acetyltransferase (GNAT) family protein n=1 Tax=Shimia sagamensis TaxID=1566352 RepID=A0ABY1NWB6_9RHOB|nr:GNAT family N-acetyltransferase [Shimia sagamensis]SMP19300.1 Acetyltransferase (GNAT) family protein [Shimia sagamensis]